MPRFPSAASAYAWAVGILHLRRGAKALNIDPDVIFQRGIFGDFAYLDAIQIVMEAEFICANELGCERDTVCLLNWCVPKQDGSFVYRTEAEKARIQGCLKSLEERLKKLGFIDHNATDDW